MSIPAPSAHNPNTAEQYNYFSTMATTPVKETTPTSDAVNVDVAVTTEKEKTPEVTPSTLFTEKEQKVSCYVHPTAVHASPADTALSSS